MDFWEWHLGLKNHIGQLIEDLKSWTLLPGAGNHYKYIVRDENGNQIPFLPNLFVSDDKELNPEEDIPDDFYSTEYFTKKAIEFIDSTPENKPFLDY